MAALAFGVAPAMAEFGVERFAISARNQDGTPDVQAGSHPYALNTTIVLNEPGPDDRQPEGRGGRIAAGVRREPRRHAEMHLQEFIRVIKVGNPEEETCSNETAIGVATFY